MLRANPGYTCHIHALSAALVSFDLEGWAGSELRDAWRERWNIVIKALYIAKDGLRASVPFFLLEEEIDFLLEALGRLVRERWPSSRPR